MRSGKISLFWIGAALLLAVTAAVACVLAVGLGVWISRASLVDVGPPQTPTLVPPTPTIAAGNAQPPSAGVRPQSSVPGLPELPIDIPLPENIDPQSFVGGANQYSFLTDLSYVNVRDFYLAQLPDLGWEKIDYGTRLGQSSAELRYRKDDRTLTVRIVDLPFIGRLIEISLQV